MIGNDKRNLRLEPSADRWMRYSSRHADLLVPIATGLIGCAYRIAFPTRRAVAYFD
jgi:hypothetical protein